MIGASKGCDKGSAMKRVHGALCVRLALAGLMLILAGNAWGLTDEEVFRDFRFNFVIPGARAQGLGGAFIAAADDATAAEANPAALHYISRYEFFVEYRGVRPETQVLTPSEGAFGSKEPTSVDNYFDFTAVTNRDDTDFISFASFAYPFKIGRRRATLAFSRHVVLNAQNSLTDGAQRTSLDVSPTGFPVVVVVNPDTGQPSVERYSVQNTVAGSLNAEVVHYNLGFSFSLTRDFSFGVTATAANLEMKSAVESETSDPLGMLSWTHPRVDVDGALSEIRTRTMIDDSDSTFTYTVGLHWHPDSVFPSGFSPLKLGLVYRKGAEFGVEETLLRYNAETDQFEDPDTFTNVLRVPDRWGVGASYELGRSWLFSLDLERIQYSDLLEDYKKGVNFMTSGLIPPDLLSDVPGFELNVDELEFDVDDATVVHAGIEYNYYNAPDNRIRLVGIDTGDPQIDEIYLDLFRGGEAVNHYNLGFSFGTPVGLQLQLAADLSDVGNQYVMSAIYRFGRLRR
jgi:hypothetical protein